MTKSGTQPVRRKRRSPQQIRDLILTAAAREFEENGFAGATTAAIARRADTTEAQIFRFFESKAGLFHEAIFRPLNQHFSEFQSRHITPADSKEPLDTLASRYIGELQSFMEQHSGMLLSLIVADSYSPGAAQRISEVDGLKGYFERGAATMRGRGGGGPVAPELMVRVSFAAVLACVVFKDWLFPAGLASEEDIRRAVAMFTIDGIRANEV